MVRLLLLFILSSCSLVGLKKFSPNKQGLKRALTFNIDSVKACSDKRPPWHSEIKYKIKYTTLVDKKGKNQKQYLQSLPGMADSLKKCLYEEFAKINFKESSSSKKISIVFNLNAL